MVGVEGEEPGPARGQSPHREHSRIVGVEHVPALGLRDSCDRGFDLRQLVERADPVLVEVVLGDVGHDRYVVVVGPHPSEKDPAARRFQHGEVDARLPQRTRRPAEPGVVTFFDQLVVAIDAVGGRVSDVVSGRSGQLRDQPHRGGLAVRSGHRDDGNGGAQHGGRGARLRSVEAIRRRGDGSLE